jgi:hypothetical protein
MMAVYRPANVYGADRSPGGNHENTMEGAFLNAP